MSDIELLERLEKLERSNRRLKRGALASLVLVAALAGIYATRPVPDVIKAHRFELIGLHNGGRPIALLGNAGDKLLDEPVLEFFGPEPLAPEDRVLPMKLGVTPLPTVRIYPAFGSNKENDALVDLGTLGNEPRLRLSSARGKFSGYEGSFLFYFDNGAPAILLVGNDKKHRVIWQAP
jgi:hypothetical protein